MRILVAGAGLFGREHLARLVAQGVVVAVADPVQASADRAQADFGVMAGADASLLMDAFQPHGMIIAAPGDAHLPLARAALARRIPVLVEKPVALTAADARQIALLATSAGTFAMPGHILRFSAQHRALARAVQDGAVGPVLSVTSRRYRDAGHAIRYADIDPVLMTMIHDIDLALWLTGRTAVFAQANRTTGRDGRSVTRATLRDSGGGLWDLAAAWSFPVDAAPPDRVEVLGEDGSLELLVGSGLTSTLAGRMFASDPAEDALGVEQAAFLAAVHSGRVPQDVTMQDAVDGLTAAEMILADLHRPRSG